MLCRVWFTNVVCLANRNIGRNQVKANLGPKCPDMYERPFQDMRRLEAAVKLDAVSVRQRRPEEIDFRSGSYTVSNEGSYIPSQKCFPPNKTSDGCWISLLTFVWVESGHAAKAWK
ncbi:hypothetical protein AB6A40_003489 [Gnathostoma spinigerum]|uniref:Uncharacterized protein n=1 Tax=Gnathostoma spinigerum TaxID=75299 RepID=A0ABD6EAW8_9BILA